jgi:serine-type D-Ala-D-Ala carboxypeptidase (penicillin-binding protein 5/6)
MLRLFQFLKNHYLDFLIILLILAINLFWLPTFSHWSLYPSSNTPAPKDQISQISLPKTPIIKLADSPQLTTNNYILIDVSTNKILLSKNPDARIYPASITKLATAMTALNIYPLDEVITIDQEYKEGKVMELELGEKITVKSLVSAILVYSANDAAYTLARNHPQGLSGFIKQMNLISEKYNLNDTHFTNVDGIHQDSHYSTVYDLSQLGRISIQNKTVSSTVKTKEMTVSSLDNSIKHQLTSTNELLGVIPEVEGLKTGWTPEAKGCFISLININDNYLISVVAQSDDRFQDTRQLINWAKKNVVWRN